MTYTTEELQKMIDGMRAASNQFYAMATAVGNHAFIEFTGLMNEYIKVCEHALSQGIDFTECNVHTGKMLPMQPFHVQYLGEKLSCIYSTSLQKPENWQILESMLARG